MVKYNLKKIKYREGLEYTETGGTRICSTAPVLGF
jgi:hypothetical protein